MLRSFLLLVLGPVAAVAGTLYVNATCNGTTTRDVGEAMCGDWDTGSRALAERTGAEAYAWSSWPPYYPITAEAEARSDFWYELTITPADLSLTTGTYMPCLTAQASGTRGGSSSYAQWNGIRAEASRTGQGEWSGTCIPPPGPGSGLEVTFGVPQLVHVTYYARADVFIRDAQVGAQASGGPLVVLDEFGTQLQDVTWSLTEVPAPVPEPGTLLPLSVLLFGVVLRRGIK